MTEATSRNLPWLTIRWICRLLAAAVGLLLPVLPAEVHAVERPAAGAPYAYDGHDRSALPTYTTLERGPPASVHTHTNYDAAERWSRGGSARPHGPQPESTTTAYAFPGNLVQVARTRPTTGTEVGRLTGSFRRFSGRLLPQSRQPAPRVRSAERCSGITCGSSRSTARAVSASWGVVASATTATSRLRRSKARWLAAVGSVDPRSDLDRADQASPRREPRHLRSQENLVKPRRSRSGSFGARLVLVHQAVPALDPPCDQAPAAHRVRDRRLLDRPAIVGCPRTRHSHEPNPRWPFR